MKITLLDSRASVLAFAPPQLTIAIPTWNRATLLREQLLSLDAHLSDKVELVVCDNGSTDDTWTVLQDCVATTPHRMRAWRNGVNLGADVNYLRVLELACGNWVWLVGDDDCIDFGLIRTLLPSLDAIEAPLVLLLDREFDGPESRQERVCPDQFFAPAFDELGMQIMQVGRVLCRTELIRPMLGFAHAVAAGNLHSYSALYGALVARDGLQVLRLPLLRRRVNSPPRWNLLRGHLGAWEASLIMYGGRYDEVNARESRLRQKPLLAIVLEQLARGKAPAGSEILHLHRRFGWSGRLQLYFFLAAFRAVPPVALWLLRLAKPRFSARIRTSDELQSQDY